MSIRIKNPKAIPSLTFNKLHIDSFLLSIERDSNTGKKHIDMTSIPYALNPDNDEPIYADNAETIRYSTKDFEMDALTYALTSGENVSPTEALTALAAEKAAVAAEIADGTLSTWKLMAYFEAALGRIHEIANLVEMEDII
jgi:hypothetical protein